MPLLGPMELEKLMKTQHYRNGKVTPSGHLAVFHYGFPALPITVLGKSEFPVPEPNNDLSEWKIPF